MTYTAVNVNVTELSKERHGGCSTLGQFSQSCLMELYDVVHFKPRQCSCRVLAVLKKSWFYLGQVDFNALLNITLAIGLWVPLWPDAEVNMVLTVCSFHPPVFFLAIYSSEAWVFPDSWETSLCQHPMNDFVRNEWHTMHFRPWIWTSVVYFRHSAWLLTSGAWCRECIYLELHVFTPEYGSMYGL